MSDRTIDPENTRHRAELVDPSAFIAPGAVVLGDVTIGKESSVWYGAVIRGDCEAIKIGEQTNVQDGCILHADPGFPCTLGNRVTLGHAAIVHGASVEDDVLIGMKAVVMNGAKIGRGSIVAVGAIVTEGTEIPPGSVAMGQPAKVKRPAEERDRAYIQMAAEHYVASGKAFKSSLACG
jgi:carbonic anhydrase/acetyltransferase-like protein (isoleucine patch superfamily)